MQKLQTNAKQFSFEMAASIMEHGFSTSFGKESNVVNAPFRTRSINSFHLRATEIEKIENVSRTNIIYVERLSICGLNGPLPTPYSELIFRRTMGKDDAMASFINTFNTRLLGISYQISKRRHLNLQDHSNNNCMLMRTISTFFGEGPSTIGRDFARLSYIFWTKEKSASGLEAVINYIFGFETHVEQFQTYWINTKNESKLGNAKLGGRNGSLLGSKASVSTLGIAIHLTSSDKDKIFRFLMDKKSIFDLKRTIKKYLGDFFDYVIKIAPMEAPPLKMGEGILGKTSWIPHKDQHNRIYECAKIL